VEIWRRYVELNLNSVYIVSKEIVPRMVAGGAVCNTSLEIGKRNVNANCVAPGATETPLLQSISREAIEAIRASIPKGRLASVDDIVPAYIFLASDESHHFVGQCISPNGGDVML
jgi:NAD(P)-dependent dehydrogenase (short-subunit alcohol dehydrogenase family)